MKLRFLNERSAVAVVMRMLLRIISTIKMTDVGYVAKSWRCQYDFRRSCSVSKAVTVTRTLGKKRTVRLWKFFNFNKWSTITKCWQQKGAINNSRITLKALCIWAMQMKEHCTSIVLVCIGCRNICANCAVLWPTTLGGGVQSRHHSFQWHVETNEQPAFSLIAMQLGECKKKFCPKGAGGHGPLQCPPSVRHWR